jgi:hypothetical protein
MGIERGALRRCPTPIGCLCLEQPAARCVVAGNCSDSKGSGCLLGDYSRVRGLSCATGDALAHDKMCPDPWGRSGKGNSTMHSCPCVFVGQSGVREGVHVEFLGVVLLISLCAGAILAPLIYRDVLAWRRKNSRVNGTEAPGRQARVVAESLVRLLSTIIIGCALVVWAARCWMAKSLRHAFRFELDSEHLLLWIALGLALLRLRKWSRSVDPKKGRSP